MPEAFSAPLAFAARRGEPPNSFSRGRASVDTNRGVLEPRNRFVRCTRSSEWGDLLPVPGVEVKQAAHALRLVEVVLHIEAVTGYVGVGTIARRRQEGKGVAGGKPDDDNFAVALGMLLDCGVTH